jgi:hypothetical protein
MTARVLNVRRLQRFTADAVEELEFEQGVNVLVGEPNAGKTMWLSMLDYLFGDPGVPEDAFGAELADKYDRARVELTVDGEPLVLERRWKERGSRGKVFIGEQAVDARDFSAFFLERLGMPLVRIPKGNPFADHTWPELSWRTLLRHIYRQEWAWGDFADRQPEGDQRASFLFFLGAAPSVYSKEYGDLVDAQKRLAQLEAQKATYEQTVHEFAREMVSVERASAGLTRDTLTAAIKGLDADIAARHVQREQAIERLRQAAVARATGEGAIQEDTVSRLEAELREARERRAELERDVSRGAERLSDLSSHLKSVSSEIDKLERARAAGEVLLQLRVTHCPVCDRAVNPHAAPHGSCYLCHQPLEHSQVQDRATSVRLDFEWQQLKEEATELKGLVERAQTEHSAGLRRLKDAEDEVQRLEMMLQPVRVAAAWVLPPEVAVADQEVGQLQERTRQLQRLTGTLDRREQFSRSVDDKRQEVARLDAMVEQAKAVFRFAERGDQLADAMRDYLNELDAPDRERWGERQVAVAVSESSVRFFVDGVPWKRKVGAHLRAYFFLAYQYALLKLCRTEPFTYPGFAAIDFPVNLSEEFGISDQENYLLRPFVRLLESAELKGTQLIAAGRGFAGLEGAHRIDLLPRR